MQTLCPHTTPTHGRNHNLKEFGLQSAIVKFPKSSRNSSSFSYSNPVYSNRLKTKIKRINLPYLSANLFIFNNIGCHFSSVLVS